VPNMESRNTYFFVRKCALMRFLPASLKVQWLNLNAHHGNNSRHRRIGQHRRTGEQDSRSQHHLALRRYGGITVIMGRFLVTDLNRTLERLLYTLHRSITSITFVTQIDQEMLVSDTLNIPWYFMSKYRLAARRHRLRNASGYFRECPLRYDEP
jgi:hypothetical protein